MKDNVTKLIGSLGEALGLSHGGKHSNFEIVKALCEQALGCTVLDDGTMIMKDARSDGDGDSEPETERHRKRRKAEISESTDQESDDEDEESGEEGGSPAGATADSDEEGADGSGSDEESGEEGIGEEEEEEEDGDGEYEPDTDGEDEPMQTDFEPFEEDTLEDGIFTTPVGMEDGRPAKEMPSLDLGDASVDPEEVLAWLLSPLDLETFLDGVQEAQAAFISRPNARKYFDGLLSRKDIDALLRRPGGLQYSYNVDVTHYSRKGVRENFNFNGKKEKTGTAPETANPDVVWRRVDKDGCSLRLLHPQRFCEPLWRLLSKLEDFWRSPVGANAYLTPAGAQGFAPHFDDIDAFVLQLEGAKRWRLYAPTDPRNVLPRHSSRDFTDDELGDVIMDVVLRPGDLLYMPRGMVHQAVCLDDSHSLHLTISANQQRTWQRLLEAVLPRALEAAAGRHRQLRAAVPREVSLAAGTAPLPAGSVAGEIERIMAKASVEEHAKACVDAVIRCVDWDWGADRWEEEFLLSRLPPPPATAIGSGSGSAGAKAPKIKAGTQVAIVHPGAARLMLDADGEVPLALVAHCMANKRGAHAAVDADGSGEEENGEKESDDEIPPVLEFPAGCEETLAELLSAEEPVKVGDVTAPEEDAGVDAAEVAAALVKAGLLRVVGEEGGKGKKGKK